MLVVWRSASGHLMADEIAPVDHDTGVPRNPDTRERSNLDFPVVGLGASAGGLVALKTFLENLPKKTGLAFVVILHLSPKHESVADKVLQGSTRMPVIQVSEPTPLEPDHVYVISPNQDLTMSDGHLRVTEAQRPAGTMSRSTCSSARSPTPFRTRPSESCCPAPARTARSASPASRSRAG